MANKFILNSKQLAIVSTLELRAHYKQLLAAYQDALHAIEKARGECEKVKKANELKIDRVKQKHSVLLARTRFNRDRRIDRLTFKLFKRSQRVFALRRDLKKRLAPIRDSKVRNKREVMKRARAQGFKAGMQKSFRVRKQEIYRAGYRDGRNDFKLRTDQTRRGIVYKSATISSIAKVGALISKLSRAIGLSAEYIALFLWMGEYDSFFFYELKAAMDSAGETLFYKKIYYLKEQGYVQKIAQKKKGAIWALTPLGRAIHNRSKWYISRHLSESKDKYTEAMQ